MTQCPDIEGLLERQALAREHAGACLACSAVLSLAELREERSASRGDACVEAEVLLALGSEGLLDPEQQAALSAHLESCAECGEVAVRVHSSAGAVPGEVAVAVGAEPSPRPRWGLALGFAASLCAAAALGALWMRSRSGPSARLVSEAPRALPAPPPVGAAVERPLIAPSAAPPSVPSIAPLAPIPPPPKPALVDPWASVPQAPATSAPPAPVPGTGYLTIMCVPSCDAIRAQGKLLGPSPIVRAPMPSGPLNVELRRGATRRYLRVQIVADQTTARRVSMEPEPEVMDPWR